MKPSLTTLVPVLLAICSLSDAAEITYVNYVRQTQIPAGVSWDASDTVAASGSQQSALAINPGGAQFDLWTVASSPTKEYLLDTTYVGSYVPIAQVMIDTGDPYGKDLSYTGTPPRNLPAMIRRTRADKPFTVYVTVSGLLNGATDPDASKSVTLMRHVQSYGANGTGVNLDRTQATVYSQASISTNGLQTLTYALTSIPGADRSKVRGEERFSVFSLRDLRGGYDIPATQLASQFIQIWPVADGSISGIAQNQLIRFSMPTVTLTLNDLYPDSRTYAQVYRGNPVLGKTGTIVPGSALNVTDSVPNNRTLTLINYDDTFDGDGRWTMELLTVTPFGIDRLAYVSFDLDRTLEVNSTVTTIE